MSEYDAPNQQVVRGDGSGPADEGEGGSAPVEGTGGTGGAPASSPLGLDDMTKEQLLEFAQQLQVSPANNAMTKDELRAAIDAKLGPGVETQEA